MEKEEATGFNRLEVDDALGFGREKRRGEGVRGFSCFFADLGVGRRRKGRDVWCFSRTAEIDLGSSGSGHGLLGGSRVGI
ncbi:hypothetical protein HAX54_017854 [Datura stramonium]|uniref:Uncharacterized protein n=1 Tax=Datura stramonium TaxID=4076 RepID=A0ABS8UNM2_DATST|nr:hypothetical protein [Datura stramonium]